jgi:hypothetical protein
MEKNAAIGRFNNKKLNLILNIKNMEQQLDGVKVSINNSEKNSNNAPAKKKPAVNKNSEAKNDNKPNKKQLSLMTALIVTFVAVLIVGGGVYAWKNQAGLKDITKIKDEAKSSRLDFEQRLANLKDQITGMEKEKEGLKSASEELKTAEELLAKAQIEYSNTELGLNFKYPAKLGQIDITIAGGEKGKIFKGIFSNTDKIVFSGVTKDYSSASTTASSSVLFLDTVGYTEKNKKFYFQPAGNIETNDYEIVPAKIIGEKENRILLVDKKSFLPSSSGKTVDIGENIGAIINLKNASFTGVAFMDQDLGVLPLANFEEVINYLLDN